MTETRRRFLFTTQPAIGHIQPMLPVASALQAAGHVVAFASGPSAGKLVNDPRFEFFGAGLDWLGQPGAAKIFPEIANYDLVQCTAWFQQTLFADRAARAMFPDVLAIAGLFKPDAIVRETWEFSGCLVAETLGIPHASISAALSFDIWKSSVAPQLARLRADLGLPADPALTMLHRHLELDLVPARLQFPGESPRSVRQVIRALADAVPNVALPEWFEKLPKRPNVYLTAGTVFNEVPGFFAKVLEALKDEDVNVIATVGRFNAERLQAMRIPANARVLEYFPQAILLPHCDLMVCHGGFNTIFGALSSGVPMVVVPMAADQGQNATRVAAIGAGVAIPFHPGVAKLPHCEALLDAPTFEVASIRDAVRELLREPRYRDEARRMAEEITSLPGPAEAAKLLVALAERGVDPAGPHRHDNATAP